MLWSNMGALSAQARRPQRSVEYRTTLLGQDLLQPDWLLQIPDEAFWPR